MTQNLVLTYPKEKLAVVCDFLEAFYPVASVSRSTCGGIHIEFYTKQEMANFENLIETYNYFESKK